MGILEDRNTPGGGGLDTLPATDEVPRRGPLDQLVGVAGRWLVIVTALVAAGLLIGMGPEPVKADGPTAGLPDGVDSTEVARLQEQLPSSDVAPAIVVFDRGGEELGRDDLAAIRQLSPRLQELSADPDQELVVAPSPDRTAAIALVPLSTSLSDADLRTAVEDLRGLVDTGLPDGLRAQVTGGPAYQVDLAAVFDGANTTLLAVTAGVVALLLLITYRSPWLWLVPLAVIGTADQVATRLVGIGTETLGFTVDESTIGITSVLVFGAGTNYALLLIARYREELHRLEDRTHAMALALRQAGGAVLASSSTVVLALLSLSFADDPGLRSLGYAGAIGIVTAVVFALVVLPAAMVVFPRGLFWPFVPRVGDDAADASAGVWGRIGSFVVRRPWPVMVASVAVIVGCAAGALGITTGLSLNEQFRATPEAVTGQEVLARAFPAGSGEPTVVLTSPDRADEVLAAVRGTDGVAEARLGPESEALVEIDATLDAAPESARSAEIVQGLRDTLGDSALVGGADAEAVDARATAEHDRSVIIPIILAVVVVVLLLLLRSVVAALLLVATVVATYAASMGASWLAIDHLFGFPALDLDVPLLAFLFLVALGVDYNIFLATRAREEAAREDTRSAIASALAVTGGVITSAGVLLAAVFTVLGVLPLIVLTQLGVIVGFGVLLDTLLVRSLLVPALVAVLGDRFWWPGRPRLR
ncbi:MMPL family transporter [Nocardioides sp. MAHUQ-72]|uniref:MMPL family transporter n=1 Tax=unclassified Nocardioides TaxID=2615069 RepID=UPI003610851A